MFGEDFLESCLAGIATGKPNDLRRRAQAVLKIDEIAVLGHHHRACSGRLSLDDFIVGIPQADIPDRKRRYRKILTEPSGQTRRKLGIKPQSHAASTG